MSSAEEPERGKEEGTRTMFLWIAAGYIVSAIAFYSYIVATAQEDPYEAVSALSDTTERTWTREQSGRKAA